MSQFTAHKRAGFISGKAAGAPDEAQLAALNRYTLEPLTAEQVYVRTAYVAHNAIDRDDEAFADALLSDFARTLPGKGLFIKHPMSFDGDSGPGVGRWFAARVVEMSQDEARAALGQPDLEWPPGVERAKLLEAPFYIPRTSKNADLTADIDAGVAGDVSIGFTASKRAPIERDGDYAGSMLFGPGEALEASLVFLGAQPGARVTKSANKQGNGGTAVDELEKANNRIKALEGEKAAAEQKAREAEAKAKSYDDIKAAVGEEMIANPTALAQAVTDGKAYRKELQSELVGYDRLQGLVGDGEEDIKAAAALYDGVPIATLKARAEAGRKKFAGKSQIQGSDPNASGASGEKSGGLRDASKTRKAAGLD